MDAKTFKWIIDRLVERLDRQNEILERIARSLEAQAQPIGTIGPFVVGPVDFRGGAGGCPGSTTFNGGIGGSGGRGARDETSSSSDIPPSK